MAPDPEDQFRTKAVPLGGAGNPKVLVALSGRKGAGKSTLCRFLRDNATALWPPPPFERQGPAVVLGNRATTTSAEIFSMAGPLKTFCREVLGLTHAQCYGTEADKNTLTRYRWEDLPHYPRIQEKVRSAAWDAALADWGAKSFVRRWADVFRHAVDKRVEDLYAATLPRGAMTGRHVQQEFGTGVVRAMWADAWNQSFLRAVEASPCRVALCDDVRFGDECAAVVSAGGVVYRLPRAPAAGDAHASETGLDGYAGFTRTLPADESLEGSCLTLLSNLLRDGLLARVPPAALLKFPS